MAIVPRMHSIARLKLRWVNSVFSVGHQPRGQGPPDADASEYSIPYLPATSNCRQLFCTRCCHLVVCKRSCSVLLYIRYTVPVHFYEFAQEQRTIAFPCLPKRTLTTGLRLQRSPPFISTYLLHSELCWHYPRQILELGFHNSIMPLRWVWRAAARKPITNSFKFDRCSAPNVQHHCANQFLLLQSAMLGSRAMGYDKKCKCCAERRRIPYQFTDQLTIISRPWLDLSVSLRIWGNLILLIG